MWQPFIVLAAIGFCGWLMRRAATKQRHGDLDLLTIGEVFLYSEITMLRSLPRNRRVITGLAAVAALAFAVSMHYCVCETFAGSHPQADASHQHDPSSHHDTEHSSPGSQSDPCCSTLLAITTPRENFNLVGSSAPVLQARLLHTPSLTPLVELSMAPTGLSPPPRAPTPRLPFYRTTYANHAPPVRLA
jgi:hypothetical protein